MEDLSRYWSTEYHHNYSWQFVASLYWKRYPNPHSKHVYSEDTIDVKVSSMLLHNVRGRIFILCSKGDEMAHLHALRF